MIYKKEIMERIISLAENFENTKSAQYHAEIPVFAAIADENNQVLSIAGNAVESTKCVWFHAEFLAISRAIEIVQSKYLDNCSIYVTLEPCSFCASMIEKTRIKNIYFGAYNPKYGAIYHNANLFN